MRGIVMALQEIKGKVDVIYLVGGCNYTYSMLKPAIQSKYPEIPLVVLKCHKLAVSQGTVLCCHSPEKIIAGKMDASYGNGFFFNSLRKVSMMIICSLNLLQKVSITNRFVDTILSSRQKNITATFKLDSSLLKSPINPDNLPRC